MPFERGELFIKSFDYGLEGLGNWVRLGRLQSLYRSPLRLESIQAPDVAAEKGIEEAENRIIGF